ncbi:HlyD family secretion protein [Pollutibacter soli]|uniref:HlyD family secretion protein n=1 Tax=Pollutibacter soli TaxID=3034157 RepID=UPI0030134304
MSLDFINKNTREQIEGMGLSSYDSIYLINRKSRVKYWVFGIFAFLLTILFLPWTQNIRSRGAVTTLRQEQRPQELPSIIPGKIAKWHVKEGDYVKKGDTIVQIAEIKDDYLDPKLLERTQQQIDAKSMAIENYRNKVSASGQQITALKEARDLKLKELANKVAQQELKIMSDSIEMRAALNDLNIKTEQFSRQKVMYDSGLASLVQLEQRNQAYQESLAKKTSAEIKFSNSKQELLRLQLERNGEMQQYLEKISKAEGERFQSLSEVQAGSGEVAKLQNQYMNYSVRSGLYVLTAPQDGQVVRAKKAGFGEIVKDGEIIVEIVPTEIDYAIEVFIRPVDLPLLADGQKARIIFDGFPAIVFSGWPESSYGTFGGIVAAIETSVSPNGMFRILIREDSTDKRWPRQLKLGTGAQSIALLNNVPVWYELWRNINGFPPDYYKIVQSKPKKSTIE